METAARSGSANKTCPDKMTFKYGNELIPYNIHLVCDTPLWSCALRGIFVLRSCFASGHLNKYNLIGRFKNYPVVVRQRFRFIFICLIDPQSIYFLT